VQNYFDIFFFSPLQPTALGRNFKNFIIFYHQIQKNEKQKLIKEDAEMVKVLLQYSPNIYI
jgi:hypothetical protein